MIKTMSKPTTTILPINTSNLKDEQSAKTIHAGEINNFYGINSQ